MSGVASCVSGLRVSRATRRVYPVVCSYHALIELRPRHWVRPKFEPVIAKLLNIFSTGPSDVRLGKRRALVASLCAIASLGLVGCADNDLPVAEAGVELEDYTGQKRVEIIVTDNVFTPRHIEISIGTTVVWLNKGRNSHNVLPAEGDVFEKTDLPVGGQVEITFTDLGSIPYYCSIHGTKRRGQTGTIVVTAAS